MAETVKQLAELVRENYAARERGELPDEWFWADIELMRRGYFVVDGELTT